MESGVYIIRNLINGKVYIGSSVNLKNRQREHWSHLQKGNHHNVHLQHAWNKYGEKAFVFETVEYVEESWLLLFEQKYIDQYCSYDGERGYNICKVAGNTLGFHHSSETKEQISNLNKGRVMPEDAKRRISEANSGSGNYFYGKHHTDETKRKISEANKGRKRTEEQRARLRGLQVGEKSAVAKHTWEEVREARKLYSSEEMTATQLKEKYNWPGISIMLENKTWYDKEYSPPIKVVDNQPKLSIDVAKEIRQKYGNPDNRPNTAEISKIYGIQIAALNKLLRNDTYFDPDYRPIQVRPRRK